MAVYSLEFIEEASRDLRRLDLSVEPNWLRGDLGGLAKIREGDYRIICQLLDSRRVILIHFIGHRIEVYKRR
jgi:mRNA-degrading endonuclease RelE of RelBE toxin-antitoxin system